MSIWVRAVATTVVADFTRDGLRASIAERLTLLTYLVCPEHEEEPDAVIARLRIEDVSEPSGNLVWLLHYRVDDDHFIRLERWQDPKAVREEADELAEFIEERSEPGADEVRTVLRNAKESIGLELKVSDASSMGWPLALAVAAHFAQAGAGLVQADGSGWMRPTRNEVETVLDE